MMAIGMNGNLSDYSVRKQNYSSCAAMNTAGTSAAGSVKKKEAENTSKTTGNNKGKDTANYASELAKLVPSVDFKVGSGCSSAKSGKSLTINPKLLEKMQNDPAKEKDMKDMIKGVESMSKMAESIAKATGWTIVYQHSYIDENGKYHCRMQTRNDGMLKLSAKLREERKELSEKLFERSKEKAAAKKEEAEEIPGEKEAVQAGEETAFGGSAYGKAGRLLYEKMAASQNGTIYLNDTDIRTIIEAAREEDAGKPTVRERAQVGANLDLKG